jgi:hypothetical protein
MLDHTLVDHFGRGLAKCAMIWLRDRGDGKDGGGQREKFERRRSMIEGV